MTPRNIRTLLGAGLFLATGAFLSCSRSSSPRQPPDALLVTIDTLRGDRWGCVGDPWARSPVADRVARTGLLLPEGRASAPITLPSHTTILTGLPPVSHSVRDNGIFRLSPTSGRTLAEALRDSGWMTAAFVSAYPLAERFGLDRGFQVYNASLGGEDEPEVMHSFPESRADEVLERLRRFFDRKRAPAPEVPFFCWVHFFDPHAPYNPPAPWAAACGDDAYRGEVAFTDRMMGAFLAELEQRRPNAIRHIVVTSDHGEGLGDHGERTHGLLLRESTIRVPIVVADGRKSPGIRLTPVSLDRIAATVLASLGLPASLLPDAAPSVEAPATGALSETMYPWTNFGWRALRAWEHDGWKLVNGETDRLYRTKDDPGERSEVSAANPDVAARLRSELLGEWSLRQASAFHVASDTLDAEDIEALRSLGYAAGSTHSSGKIDLGFDEGSDPEPRVEIVDEVNRAVTLYDEGKLAEAKKALRTIVAREPRNRLAWEYLGRAALASGDARAARDAFRQALELGPNPVDVHLDLARAARELGNDEEERAALEKALAVDPLSIPARQGLFRIAIEQGKIDVAIRLMEEAVQIRPRSAESHVNLAELYEKLARPQDAIAHWKKAAESDPKGPIGERARAALVRLEEGGA